MNAHDMQDPDEQELKGHVEEAVGNVFGDDDLVAHGKADQLAAHAKQAAAQAGEAARNVGQRLKDGAMQKLGELHERLHEATDGSASSTGTEGSASSESAREPGVAASNRQSPETSEDR